MKTNTVPFSTVLSELNVKGVVKRQYRGIVQHVRTVRLPEIAKSAAAKLGVQEGLFAYYADDPHLGAANATVLFDK